MRHFILRCGEIIVIMLLVVLFTPLFLIIAFAIIVESGWPIVFASPRIGKHGHMFSLLYFRTMRCGDETSEQRLTHVGRFLRNYSLDHMPQVLNILRGEMHIVGPCPMAPEEVTMQNQDFQRVLQVNPGMFSPAIVTLGHAYNHTDFATKVRLEASYLHYRTWNKDLRFILATLQAFVASRGNIKKRGKASQAVCATISRSDQKT